jgi:hypothetical protein
MRDFEIRLRLRDVLRAKHQSEPDTLIVEELGLREGSSRVDLAVINGSMHGFEIKSDRDKLSRLPSQSYSYGMCFDAMTIVVGERHLGAALEALPEWWGVIRASDGPDGVVLDVVRDAAPNPDVRPEVVVQLLWRDEALAILREHDLAKRFGGRPRREMWAALVDALSPEQVGEVVRTAIKARGDWRSERRQARGSDSSPTHATCSGRPEDNLNWLLSLEFPDPPG